MPGERRETHVTETLGERIQRHRQDLGLTVTQLAKLMGDNRMDGAEACLGGLIPLRHLFVDYPEQDPARPSRN